MTEMWPREVNFERARAEAEAVLQRILHPSEHQLKLIYSFWLKKHYWTIEEAAALIMGADPEHLLAAYEVLPPEDRRTFDLMVDLIRRKFPDEVIPADLREWAPTIGIINDLFWSAIDHYCPRQQKPIGKSGETKKEKTRDKMVFGLALHAGYRSDRNNNATGIIKRNLDGVGISLDEDTIHGHLEELAKLPELAKVEAEYRKAKKL